MFKQRFCYKDQKMNINDTAIFVAMLILNIALFFSRLFLYLNGNLDFTAELTCLILLIIFNVPIITHFIVKTLSIIRFKTKMNKFKINGKRFITTIIDEEPTPLIKSDTGNIYMYYPIVKFYNSDTNKYSILKSKYPMCASYQKSLSSDKVIIYVIDEDFLIFDFSKTDDKNYSLERRTNEDREIADTVDKAFRTKQIIYGISAIIYGLFILGLQFLVHFLFG